MTIFHGIKISVTTIFLMIYMYSNCNDLLMKWLIGYIILTIGINIKDRLSYASLNFSLNFNWAFTYYIDFLYYIKFLYLILINTIYLILLVNGFNIYFKYKCKPVSSFIINILIFDLIIDAFGILCKILGAFKIHTIIFRYLLARITDQHIRRMNRQNESLIQN